MALERASSFIPPASLSALELLLCDRPDIDTMLGVGRREFGVGIGFRNEAREEAVDRGGSGGTFGVTSSGSTKEIREMEGRGLVARPRMLPARDGLDGARMDGDRSSPGDRSELRGSSLSIRSAGQSIWGFGQTGTGLRSSSRTPDDRD